MRKPRNGRLWAVALVLPLALGACTGDDEPSATPSYTQGVDPAGPDPAKASTAPTVGTTTAPPVAVGKPAQLTPDLKAQIGKIRKVTVKAETPGEIAGPAVAVPVTLTNSGTKPFDVTALVVNVSYADGTPAEETAATPAQPITGQVPPDEKVTGTYVFRVPSADRSGELLIEVDTGTTATVVTFKS